MNDLELSLSFRPSAADMESVRRLPHDLLPSISVVIPSFNQASFLRETLESVFAQSYPNMEVFVADGGSRDGSIKILEEYAARLPGTAFRFDSRPDGGHWQGVNKGIANTSGDIVAWINSDDIYLPDAFWKVAAFFHFNRATLIAYGRNRYVDQNLDHVTDYPVDWSPLLREQRRRMMHFCLPPQPSLFFRRAAVTLCGALGSKILDYELWLRWQRDLPFGFIDDHLSLSRLHADAITANADHSLLNGICRTVHQYYGCVPYSWAFRYAYTVKHGAAWARRENPAIGRSLHLRARLLWVWLNLKWAPGLFKRNLVALRGWLRESARISS